MRNRAIACRKWEKATVLLWTGVLLWTAMLLSPVRADAVLATLTDDTYVDSSRVGREGNSGEIIVSRSQQDQQGRSDQ